MGEAGLEQPEQEWITQGRTARIVDSLVFRPETATGLTAKRVVFHSEMKASTTAPL
jgi:hypothetical protein